MNPRNAMVTVNAARAAWKRVDGWPNGCPSDRTSEAWHAAIKAATAVGEPMHDALLAASIITRTFTADPNTRWIALRRIWQRV